ncbi:alpha/beta hydrolase [Actinoplanes sp. NPDC049548]|uniref:alpha/beta hydrolase n=1 Tax=Actinoplanes sp. NPDC049548 TaxID=3155152 RepID=UPI00343942DC
MLVDESLAALRQLSWQITPETRAAHHALFSPLHEQCGYLAPVVHRDLPYGADARQRLDVHTAPDAAGRPVLVFVHGGGFVAGGKTVPGSPFYDHIGGWAARHHLVAVTMTYRLAPEHRWPAGAEDVADAVSWVHQHIAEHGGDPDRIILMGHSAGGAHVAGYLAGQAGTAMPGVAAAVLLSAFFDPALVHDQPTIRAYFGDDFDRYPVQSSVAGLVECKSPLLIATAERDLPPCHRQATTLLDAMQTAGRPHPLFLTIPDHTHLSEIYSLGLDDEAFGGILARFVSRLPLTK